MGRHTHTHNIAISSTVQRAFSILGPISDAPKMPKSNRNAIILISNRRIKLITVGMWPSIHYYLRTSYLWFTRILPLHSHCKLRPDVGTLASKCACINVCEWVSVWVCNIEMARSETIKIVMVTNSSELSAHTVAPVQSSNPVNNHQILI